MVGFFKKYHKWLGLFFTALILLFAVSGIVLNHRSLFAPLDVSRTWLPAEYQLQNWNNAAVAGTCRIGADSLLMYGNIGIWLTDDQGKRFLDYNQGFPEGMDNRKISKVLQMSHGALFAGSYFGLYRYSSPDEKWKEVVLPLTETRITDLISKGDSLLVLTRSELLVSRYPFNQFEVIHLRAPLGYTNEVSLFKTLWIIHSGELLGLPGKLLVDFIGFIFIFLTLTGLVFWMVPHYRKGLKKSGNNHSRSLSWRKLSLKWHNKVGWITIVLLVITSTTGMFLRPPLLAAVFDVQVGKISGSVLDTPNPWYDKLRKIVYDPADNQYYVATLDVIFTQEPTFTQSPQGIIQQPPISVMGVNAFELVDEHTLLVGSFEGLFLWDAQHGFVADYIKKGPVKQKERGGPPIGEFLVTGYSDDFSNGEYYFDFNTGMHELTGSKGLVNMPKEISELPMSLWNVALEVHTARIFQSVFGMFYILIIPVSGLVVLFILISGFVVWYQRYHKKNGKN